MTDRDSIAQMLLEVTDTLGPVDVLVNNAGIGVHASSAELSDDDWTA